MIYTIIAILVVLWLIGLIGDFGGGIIHALLVIAALVFLYNMFVGRKKV